MMPESQHFQILTIITCYFLNSDNHKRGQIVAQTKTTDHIMSFITQQCWSMTWLVLLTKEVLLIMDYCDDQILNLYFPYSYDTIASWATNLKTSIRKANKALWLSVAFIVLFAALISFLTGRFFQKSVDAAPTQDGDSWMSLEHILWPFTKLRHNGPPPVWP